MPIALSLPRPALPWRPAAIAVRLAPWARYAACVLVVAAADLGTKALAAWQLADGAPVPLGERFALLLLYNTGMAGGGSLGAWTLPLTLMVTLGALALITAVVPPLGALQRQAPLALGCIAGGALGNLASAVTGPPGVADFLAWRVSDYAIVCNVADLALWGGALLLAPVAGRLAVAIRRERAQKPM